MDRQSLRLVLLQGGTSSEREVSLASGANMAKALESLGHQVTVVDPAEVDLAAVTWAGVDVCVLALHGGAGEDGRVQQWLDDHGVVYTGSGPGASRLAMNKSAAKEAFRLCGVDTPDHALLRPVDTPMVIDKKVARLGYPLIVKPNGQGSSLGVHLVRDRTRLAPAVADARQFDPLVMAERFVTGREMTVSVLGRQALPIVEIVTSAEVFDYRSKYSSGATEYRLPTGLGPMKTEEIEQQAAQAVAALSTVGLVRVDLILDETQCPWVLEVNTLPGMTERSLAPRAALAAGLDLSALCEWIVRDAIERAGRRRPLHRAA